MLTILTVLTLALAIPAMARPVPRPVVVRARR